MEVGMFSARNGITMMILGGVIILLDFGNRGNPDVKQVVMFLNFDLWIGGAIIAGLGLIFLIGGIIKKASRRVER
jgi:hypothetical protein